MLSTSLRSSTAPPRTPSPLNFQRRPSSTQPISLQKVGSRPTTPGLNGLNQSFGGNSITASPSPDGSNAMSQSFSPYGLSGGEGKRSLTDSLRSHTMAKVAELKNKITSMDQDLEKQTMVRNQRENRLENVVNDINSLHNLNKQTTHRLQGLEETATRLELGLDSEKDARGMVEKQILKYMDEKVKEVTNKLDHHRISGDNDVDSLRKRCYALEERCVSLATSLDEERQLNNTLEVGLNHVNSQLVELQSSFAAERVKRNEEHDNARTYTTGQFSHLSAQVENEKMLRERDVSQLTATVQQKWDDTESLADSLRKEMEAMLRKTTQPIVDELRMVQSDLMAEKQAREQGDANTLAQAKGHAQWVLDEANRNEQDQSDGLSYKMKILEDRVQRLDHGLEKEREGRLSADRHIMEELATEKRDREEAEQKMTELLDKTMDQIHNGLEKMRYG